MVITINTIDREIEIDKMNSLLVIDSMTSKTIISTKMS